MNIVWIGNHAEGVAAFRETAERRGVSAFITLSDSAFGKRSAGSREYLEICEAYRVPCFAVDTIKGDEAYEIIARQQPDLLVVLGWSEILPERVLKLASIGVVGAHASLLPHNRGSAPINWALIHGESKTGNTLMWLDAEVDAGAIIDQMEFPITPFDTCQTLYERVAETNAVMLRKLLDSLETGVRPLSGIDNRTDEPILPRRRPKDGLIDWNQSAKRIYDFIRALTRPYPGAFTYLNGEKFLLWSASVLPLKTVEAPGTILGVSYGFAPNGVGLLVAAADEVLFVTELEDANGTLLRDKALFEKNLCGRFQNE